MYTDAAFFKTGSFDLEKEVHGSIGIILFNNLNKHCHGLDMVILFMALVGGRYRGMGGENTRMIITTLELIH